MTPTETVKSAAADAQIGRSQTPGPSQAQEDRQAETQPHASAGAEAAANASDSLPHTFFAAAEEWLLSLREVLVRAIDITVLEARLAALNFALIAIVAVASGLLLATAWIALFAAIVAWFHELGLSWSLALLLVAAINLVLGLVGGVLIYRMSNNLLFKAIRKFITYGERSDALGGSVARNEPPAP